MKNWKDFRVPSKNSTLNSKIFSVVTPLACSAGGFGGLSSGLPLFWIHCRLGELGRE